MLLSELPSRTLSVMKLSSLTLAVAETAVVLPVTGETSTHMICVGHKLVFGIVASSAPVDHVTVDATKAVIVYMSRMVERDVRCILVRCLVCV